MQYQPLDTHINGVIKAQLTRWTKEQWVEKKDITLVGRKNETTRLFRKLKVSTIRRAFDEALFQPAQKQRVKLVLSQEAKDAVTAIDEIMTNWNAPPTAAMNQIPRTE